MTSIHVLLAASLGVLGADTRDILREHVQPDGQVGGQLAGDTGWTTMHAYRWQMLLVNDQTGEQTSVKPDQVFRTGTAFKLRIETYTDLYIYVLNVNSDKTVATLFPEQSEQHLLLRSGQSAKVPPDPAPPQRDQFRFTPPSGAEKFYIARFAQEIGLGQPQPVSPRRAEVREHEGPRRSGPTRGNEHGARQVLGQDDRRAEEPSRSTHEGHRPSPALDRWRPGCHPRLVHPQRSAALPGPGGLAAS